MKKNKSKLMGGQFVHPNIKSIKIKSLIWGFIGSISLFLIYLLILTIANSFKHAINQFLNLWFLMSFLIIGFGIQIYLYVFSVEYAKNFETACTTGSTIAATGSVSAGSMAACCVHHLVDVLPILGLSAFAFILAEYQNIFLELGVFSNLIGMVFMIENIKKHKLYDKKENKFLSFLVKYNLKQIKYLIFGVGILTIIISLFFKI